MNVQRYVPLFIIAALVVAVQLLATAAGQPFYLTQLTMAAYYTIVVVGLCMLMGYAGQISMGHAGFFAIGGYVSAALTTADFSATVHAGLGRFMVKAGCIALGKDLYGADIARLNPWLAFAAAIHHHHCHRLPHRRARFAPQRTLPCHGDAGFRLDHL